MAPLLRSNDPVRLSDDVVLRAGGGDVEALTLSAMDNASDYAELVAAGLIRSAFTISVNIPRVGIASEFDILASPAYRRYRPFLRASASDLLALEFVEIVATTPVVRGEAPSLLDLCHFDIVVEAADEAELRMRIARVRSLFTKGLNVQRPGTLPNGGDRND